MTTSEQSAGSRRSTANTSVLAANVDWMPGVFCLCDLKGSLLRWNQNLEKTTGLDGRQLQKLSLLDLFLETDRNRAGIWLMKVTHQQSASFEARLICQNGQTTPFSLAGTCTEMDGQVRIVTLGVDITQRKKEEDRLRSLTIVDDLTGLLNRRGFYASAQRYRTMVESRNTPLILLYADLDNLKSINDRCGHQVGDQTLIEMAGLIKSCFRGSDVIGRMGGDEFAILFSDSDGAKAGQRALERLRKRIEVSNLRRRNFLLSLSTGLVVFRSRELVQIDDWICQADLRMYQEKRAKKKMQSLGRPTMFV